MDSFRIFLMLLAAISMAAATVSEKNEVISNTTSIFVTSDNKETTSISTTIYPFPIEGTTTPSNLLENKNSKSNIENPIITFSDASSLELQDEEYGDSNEHGNVTQTVDTHNQNRTHDQIDHSNPLEAQNILNTVLSSTNRQMEFSSNPRRSMTNTIESNVTDSAGQSDASDLIDAVASLANSNLTDEDFPELAHKMDESNIIKDEEKESNKNDADNLKDLEDSSSDINLASVAAPKPANTHKQQIAPAKAPSLTDQITQPSVTRIHQVWTSSSTSDADELSPDIVGRLGNNVPFLAAYAVRPRIVRASKPAAVPPSIQLQAQPSTSNVDYSEIQVESSSTTSRHHKRQTKLKKKLKSLPPRKPSTIKNSLRHDKNQESLAQRKRLVNMVSRSIKMRQALSRRKKTKKTTKRSRSNRGKGKRQHRNSSHHSNISQLKRKLNRTNRRHHMNVIKHGRYYLQDLINTSRSGSGESDKNVTSLAVGDQTTLMILPDHKKNHNSNHKFGTKGGSEESKSPVNLGGTKGGDQSSRRKRPFYSAGKQPAADDEQTLPDDGFDGGRSDDSDQNYTEMDSGPSNDGNDEETEIVKPKYDGVDDDPEFFSEGNDEGRIDDVGDVKPSLDDEGTKMSPTSTNDEDVGIIDENEGRASRRGREGETGSRANGTGGSASEGDVDVIGDRSPSTASNNGNQDKDDSFQGDTGNEDGSSGGHDSVLGGGIGATAGGGSAGGSSSASDGEDDNNNKVDAIDDNVNGHDNASGGADRPTSTSSVEGDRDSSRDQDKTKDNKGIDNSDGEGQVDGSVGEGEGRGRKQENTDGFSSDSGFDDSNSKNADSDNKDDAIDDVNSNEPARGGDQGFKEDKDNGNTGTIANNDTNRKTPTTTTTKKDATDSGSTGVGGQHDDEDDHHRHKSGNSDHHYDDHCHNDHHNHTKWLQEAIPGEPGIDYPTLEKIPTTKFHCRDQKYQGYYADVEARCQVFHICQADGRQDSFLCPNGTIFSQISFVCVWWNSFDCEDAPKLYERNALLYRPTTSNNSNIGRVNSMMIGDNQKFNDFMESFMMSAGKDKGLAKHEFNDGDGLKDDRLDTSRTEEGLDEDSIQRKSTEISNENETGEEVNAARLRSVPRRKRRASRQPPKLKPKRKTSSRSSRRKLRHGGKPKNRRA